MTQQQTYDGPTEIVQTKNGTPTAFCSVRAFMRITPNLTSSRV